MRRLTAVRNMSSAPISATIGLLGICDDSGSSYMRGPALAPPTVRAALRSESANGFCEAGIDVLTSGNAPTFRDFGDIHESGVSSYPVVRSRVREILDAGLVPLTIGGDHSISYPVISEISACRSSAGAAGFTILHLDAHTDLYEALDGNRYSHACPLTRVMEESEAGQGVLPLLPGAGGLSAAAAAAAAYKTVELCPLVGSTALFIH